MLFLCVVMWCRVVQSRGDTLDCLAGRREDMYNLEVENDDLKKNHPPISIKNGVSLNLQLSRGSFSVGPYDFWLLSTSSVATPDIGHALQYNNVWLQV